MSDKNKKEKGTHKSNEDLLAKMAGWDRAQIRIKTARVNVPTPPAVVSAEIKSLAGQKGAFTVGPGKHIEIARGGKSFGRASSPVTRFKVKVHDIQQSYLAVKAGKTGKLGTIGKIK